MIVFENVTKKYRTGTVALDDATFQIDDNDFVFLVGPSGAGKTTILKMLLRQILPSSGTITLDGADISTKKYHDTQKLRQSIGVVFQDFKILHDKNVFENIAIALRVIGESKNIIRDKVTEALELVGLPDKGDMFPVQLSAGELQRVAIARSIIGDRNIILADEPTGNLDPKTTWEIMKIFKKLDGQKTF
jgi:cell division transport system ATP-binding protein